MERNRNCYPHYYRGSGQHTFLTSISPADKECNTSAIYITANPWNDPQSQYQWSSNLLNNGNAFISRYNPLGVTLNSGVPFGVYTFYVQEINFGCVGPFSAPLNVTITGIPKVSVTGPATVCLGDTSYFTATFVPSTCYQWTVPGGVEAFDLSNSQSAMIFDTLGNYTIKINTTNQCGEDSARYHVKVISPYVVSANVDFSRYVPGNRLL